ncbi:hypothetical protein [Paenibacillus dendritiformis]|uniref:hypothetical protein n=1 Tax=Paenibacillus dendritiformis TaxID=130049 RepID=UPI0020C57DC8|nr:hypothetical protein [Paenibacillus dendritiformis]CAH8768372.1 hypothetical protein H7S4_001067 [Paenibacillus dendritiformis]
MSQGDREQKALKTYFSPAPERGVFIIQSKQLTRHQAKKRRFKLPPVLDKFKELLNKRVCKRSMLSLEGVVGIITESEAATIC